MIVYLAGFKTIEKEWNKTTKDIYLLSSFWEHKNGKFGEYVKQSKHILDSGAFTFLNSTKIKEINWEQYVINYGNFVKNHGIKYFFELDIDSIVGLKEVEKLRNLLEKTAQRKCIPVWHKSRGLEYWKKMSLNYDYIAIGGIVTKEIKKNQYDVFYPLLKIAKENNCKVHGLGFTNMKGLEKYKFYSVDSTNWLSARFGSTGLYQFNGKTLNNIYKPINTKKIDLQAMNIFNFQEWIKFSNYAENNL
jgi:hypothetical protein